MIAQSKENILLLHEELIDRYAGETRFFRGKTSAVTTAEVLKNQNF